MTALAFACVNDSADVIEPLLRAGADPNVTDLMGFTPLMLAAKHTSRLGPPSVIDELLRHRVPINNHSIDGFTEIIVAVRANKAQTLRRLLEAGADVNASDIDGWTALIHASYDGFEECVTVLLKHGADVNSVSSNGQSALMKSLLTGREHCLRLLLSAGADISATDNRNYTVLDYHPPERGDLKELILNSRAGEVMLK